jgi:hypothetical protein
MNKSGLVAAIALAAAAQFPVGAMAADITYSVNQTIGAGSVAGTIVTDGSLGVLAQSDIVGGTVTITGSGPAESETLGVPPNIFQFLGSDLSATSSSLLFNFSGTDSGGIAIGDLGTNFFWNIGDTGVGFGTGPYPGENIFPQGNATALLSGEVAIGTTGVPEPGTWAMMILGLGGIGVALRSRKVLVTA